MTQNATGGYGVQFPRWYVKWRGRRWLRWGLCPNCYSSPPHQACLICEGDYLYGQNATPTKIVKWRQRWKDLY